jgi:hypothetical protein
VCSGEEIMPTKESYKKYEANQTKDKVVESSVGGTFKGEHWSQEYSEDLTFKHPTQDEINDMARASHKPTTSYEKLPEKDKAKPSVDSWEHTPNVRYLEAVKGLGRKLGDQDI